ncbi:uncharacterized protein LOC121714123 [Alosa sapidissima]|uniref:uncharacterized protein LOC121714123 n=1 Tax=Alosa sapidissima TaxID=34773 RepID=UPI001C09811E|nr:uncharacterized protein LOC121714123 [Alosa sapidissima]
MTMTKYKLPAFCLVLIVLSASEAIQFPGLQLISDCMEAKCGVRMKSCLRTNQGELTGKAKGCIARDCKNALKLCVKQIPKDAFAYAKVIAETAEQYADVGLDLFSDSYLQCWPRPDTHNGTQLTDCVIDDLLEKMEPLITLFGSTLFSDPAYMACWFVHIGRIFVTLATDTSNHDYAEQMAWNNAMEAQRNTYVYMKCSAMRNPDEDCINMWNRILGTPAWMKRKSKDIFVGFFHNVISASVKCQKS